MANFLAFPGRWVECVVDIGECKKGSFYQILSTPRFCYPIITLVGVEGTFKPREFAQHFKPKESV